MPLRGEGAIRHWYLALTQEELGLHRQLRFWLAADPDMTVVEAATEIGISYQKAHSLLSRAKTTAAELRERRKQYIATRLSNKRTAHRHTPHVIGCYFKVDESYVRQLIRELRDEGRLPPLAEGDKEWQDDLIKKLQRRYRMVVRAETLGNKKEAGKVYVSGKGFLTWRQCRDELRT